MRTLGNTQITEEEIWEIIGTIVGKLFVVVGSDRIKAEDIRAIDFLHETVVKYRSLSNLNNVDPVVYKQLLNEIESVSDKAARRLYPKYNDLTDEGAKRILRKFRHVRI